MGLTNVLGTALSGLRATQDALGIVSSNVANAQTPGYIRRQPVLLEQASGGDVTGVRTANAQRILDSLLQKQLRTETAGAAYTQTSSSYASALERLYGQPGDSTALDAVFNGFTQSLQSLTNDPSNSTVRSLVLNQARTLADRIRSVSNGIQQLRSGAESQIGMDVDRANELLKGIAGLNQQIISQQSPDPAVLDARDSQIDELSKLMDIQVRPDANGAVTITTQNGTRLLDAAGSVKLVFDQRGALGPTSVYDTDPTKRSVGTIMAVDPSGNAVDLIANGSLRAGEIAALVDLRDQTLVDAQGQLDELAAKLAGALSDRTQAGTALAGNTGFSVDLAGIQKGNVITLDAVVGGQAKRFSFVRVDDPSKLPLANSTTADPNDTVVGIDFSGNVQNQITAALAGTGLGVSYSGTTLSISNGGGNTATGLSATITNTALSGSGPEIPLFVDGNGNAAFTNSLDGVAQKLGFASRIVLNPAVTGSSLVAYTSTTPAGDTTRPNLMLDRMTSATMSFAPVGGIGSATSPFTNTIGSYLAAMVSTQGANAASAERLNEGQQVVLTSIQSRFAKTSGVNVDEEMANLVQLQNAYAANARVMTAAKDMLDMLLRI
jgi:flagellar hook-associated protein 1 FlgK